MKEYPDNSNHSGRRDEDAPFIEDNGHPFFNKKDTFPNPNPDREDKLAVQALRELTDRAVRQTDFTGLKQQILSRFNETASMNKRMWRGSWLKTPILKPAFTAAVLIAFIVAFSTYKRIEYNRDIGMEPVVTIQSFSGEVTEVVIFQSPQKRQTVIWFQEPLDESHDPEVQDYLPHTHI